MITLFVARLAGPLRHDFAIEHVATVSFDPQGFLVQVAKLCVCVMKHGVVTAIWTALGNDVEYNQSICSSFVDLVLARSQSIQTMLLTESEKILFETLPYDVAAVKEAVAAHSLVMRAPAAAVELVSDPGTDAISAVDTSASVASRSDTARTYEMVMRPLLLSDAILRISEDNADFLHVFRSTISSSHGAPNKMKVIKKEVDVSLSSHAV